MRLRRAASRRGLTTSGDELRPDCVPVMEGGLLGLRRLRSRPDWWAPGPRGLLCAASLRKAGGLVGTPSEAVPVFEAAYLLEAPVRVEDGSGQARSLRSGPTYITSGCGSGRQVKTSPPACPHAR